MPPFSRKQPAPQTAAPTPAEQLAAAQSALDAHLAEEAHLQAGLAEFQRRREELMREGGDIELVTSADREIYRVNLKLGQAEHRLEPLQADLQAARQAVHLERWLAFRPRLVDAEEAVASSIANLFEALERLHQTHVEAIRQRFPTNEFQKVPPGGVQGSLLNDYSLRAFLAHHAGRKVPAIAA